MNRNKFVAIQELTPGSMKKKISGQVLELNTMVDVLFCSDLFDLINDFVLNNK